MKPLIVFGAGKIGHVFSACLDRDGEFDILAHTCDAEFVGDGQFRGKPLIPFEQITDHVGPDQADMLVAVGYQDCNRFRLDRMRQAREKGYRLVSYISSRAMLHPDVTWGENVVVLDGASVQAGVALGDGVMIWDGALVGHHSTVGNGCWITGSAAVGGSVTLREGCFLGLQATVGHGVTLGRRCMIGAGTLVTKDVDDEAVIIRRDSQTHRLQTSQFFRLTQSLV
ncbi:MAG: hypothetical protein GVY16_11885 [Planctomycetes bacterium]|jgi:sugar O-acyltransferase (sialic acid O-acetyltransferase NeuD family)|nr:acetyltransferase [Phycisphaerae bacterium]NBB96423.1 hypothetical protein [Planctomycetota bacterium]